MKSQASGEEWLVISYYYGVDGLACSHHIEDRVAALNRVGIKTRVLRRSAVNSAPFLRLEKFSHYLREFKSATGFARIKNGLYFLLALFRAVVLKIVEWDEIFCFFDLAGEGHELLKKHRCARIYSTGGPLGAHIAALILAAYHRLPLVVEFQDPLPFQYPKQFRKLALLVEKIAMKCARCVFLTRQAAVVAAARCGTPVPAHIYPGAEPLAIPETYQPGKVLRLAHFGRLYKGRNTEHLLKALEKIVGGQGETKSDEAISEVQLHCYGAFDRKAYQAASFSTAGVLQLHEQVGRKQAREIMATMDVLLLIQHVDDVSRETIPSKVYEYLHTGRPILALIYRNLELAQMLEGLGHIAVQADDEVAIAQALETLLANWRSGTLPQPLSSPYTTVKAARELVQEGS